MSRDYWKYFRDDLHYPEIQKPGPLALIAQGEADGLAELFQSGLKTRDQFFPALAENEGVTIHGQARGVPRLARENSAQHRLRVSRAFGWQRLAGRHWGLYKIFAAYGLPIVSLTNLSGDHWAEFDLEVEAPADTSLGDDTRDLLYWLIFEYKRASAMPRSVRLAKVVRGKFYIGLAHMDGERLSVYPLPPELVEPEGRLYVKAAPQGHESITVYPLDRRVLVKFSRPARAVLKLPLE